MSKQAKLEDFDSYTLPEIVDGGSFAEDSSQNKNNMRNNEIDSSNWAILCGECHAVMKRSGPVNSGWDEGPDSFDRKDLFNCKVCGASVYVGLFETENLKYKVSLSSSGMSGSGHKFVQYRSNNFTVAKDKENENSTPVPVHSEKFNVEGWEEP